MLEKCASCKSSDSSRDSESESDTTEVVFYRWQTVDKKITKSRIEVTFEDAIEMLKEEVAILKQHIHIKRRQVNAYQEMKASLSSNNLMIQVNFAESYKNEQQDANQSAYFVINALAFSQRVAISTSKEKSKTITLLWSLKDQTMIDWLQWVCKKLFMKLK